MTALPAVASRTADETELHRELVFVVPGPLDQLTGGYLFDGHIVRGLRARGRVVRVIELTGRRPKADAAVRNRPVITARSSSSGASVSVILVSARLARVSLTFLKVGPPTPRCKGQDYPCVA